MQRFLATLLLIGLAFGATACVVEEPGHGGGGGWCWWHPGRCR